MVKIIKTDQSRCWWECEALDLSYPVGKNRKNLQLLGKILLSFYLKRIKIHWLYDPAIPFLGIFPRDKQECIFTKTYTQMFAGTLFVIATHWKQSNGHQWLNKHIVGYPHNGYYWTIKKNDLLVYTTTGMKSENYEEWKKTDKTCVSTITPCI